MAKAFVIDDSEEFNALLSTYLKKLGVTLQAFEEPKDFLAALKNEQPDICFIDLNIGKPDVGFYIVQAIRKVLSAEIPLFVVSSRRDEQSIAHAIEIGATDYLSKPIDQLLLASKLMPYIKSEEVSDASLRTFTVPGKGEDIFVDIELAVASIDELGMELTSNYLISKGTHLRVKTELLNEGEPFNLFVNSNWVDKTEPGTFGCYAEFSTNDGEFTESVRKWILSH